MNPRFRQSKTKVNGTPQKIVDPQTDHTRWRLRNVRGRQTWHYLSSDEELKAWPMSDADKWYLGLSLVRMMTIIIGIR